MAKGQVPVYIVLLNDDDETGVNLISFVDSPAIQANFIALSQEGIFTKLSLEATKQILTGPVLIPDQKIIRLDELNQPYYITFTADVIEKIRNKFFKQKRTDQTNAEHEIPLDNNYVVESWIITDSQKDKSVALGLEPLPVGTWMVSYKVDNTDYWNSEIVTGKRKGFSLEGLFDYKPVQLAALGMAYIQHMDQNLGYTRDEMPQIPFEELELFKSYFLAKYGKDSVFPTRFKISELKPAQKEINEEKVQEKIDSGKWKDREYLVSKDGFLIDGHHDWAAGLETNPNQEVTALLFNQPATTLIEEANSLKITHQEALSKLNMSNKNYGPNAVRMLAGKKLKQALSVIQRNGIVTAATVLSAELKQALNEVAEATAQLATTTLQDGTPVEIVEETGEVFLLDGEGKRTGAAPEGSHTLADGSTIEVKEGKLVQQMAQQTPDTAAATQALADETAAKEAAQAEVATLKTEVATLKEQVAKLSNVPATTTIEQDNTQTVKLSAAQKRVETLRRRQENQA